MSRKLLSVRTWTSPVRAMFRSVLSWMLWLLTTPRRVARRRQDRRRAAEEARLHQQESLLRAVLLEALTPLAEALLRQDKLHQERHKLLLGHLLVLQDLTETRGVLVQDMLTDVLNSLQPSARQQLMGSIPSHSSPRSGT